MLNGDRFLWLPYSYYLSSWSETKLSWIRCRAPNSAAPGEAADARALCRPLGHSLGACAKAASLIASIALIARFCAHRNLGNSHLKLSRSKYVLVRVDVAAPGMASQTLGAASLATRQWEPRAHALIAAHRAPGLGLGGFALTAELGHPTNQLKRPNLPGTNGGMRK